VPDTIDFTVIIPTKDRPALLKRALASVLVQDYACYAVIVVDDGDGQGRMVAGQTGDARVSAVVSGNGQVASRNLGVTLATGRWITFLDDDDWWQGTDHLGALAHALRYDQAGQPVLAFGSGVMVLEETRTTLDYQAIADWQSIRLDNTILVSSMAYPHALHGRLGGFDAGLPYYWDWDWYLRLAAAKVPFIAANTTAAHITCHPGSVSSAERADERRINLEAMRKKHGLGELALKNHLSLAIERQGDHRAQDDS
jgi:glycosyltransferase involved in cell wall biosynthesis